MNRPKDIYIYIYIYIYISPTPPHKQDGIKVNFKPSLAGLNSEFSFLRKVAITRLKHPLCPTTSPYLEGE